ncbi:MAG: hypothetical protein V2A56_08310 [bacterium]
MISVWRPFILAVLLLAPGFSIANPLTIERTNADALDLEYFWVSGDVTYAPFTRFPAPREEVLSYLPDDSSLAHLSPQGHYLASLYRLAWDPAWSTRPTRTRRAFQGLFQDVLGLGGFTRDLFRYNLDLFQQRDGKLVFGGNIVQRFETIYDESFKDKPFILYQWGVETWITYGNRIGAQVRFTDTTERGTGIHETIYSPYAGYIAGGHGTSISYDETVASLGYRGEVFGVRIGRCRHSWGPALLHRLVLSDQYAPYPYVEAEFDWHKRLLLTWFHGRLDPNPLPPDTLYLTPEGNIRRASKEKYIAAHRLEVIAASWMTIGMTEAVIYGERSPELGYLLPLNLYWSEGHNQDHDDNLMWSADLRLRPVAGVLLFGELLIDEMHFSAFGTDEFGNRTAYTVGGRWLPSSLDGKLDLRTEYTKLRPFIYTHWFPINVPTQYGENLGSPLQPNSDEWRFRLRYHPAPEFTLGVYAWSQRHSVTPEGADPVGGSVWETRKGNEGTYPFLAGVREDRNESGVEFRWQALEELLLFAEYGRGTNVGESYNRFITGFHFHY